MKTVLTKVLFISLLLSVVIPSGIQAYASEHFLVVGIAITAAKTAITAAKTEAAIAAIIVAAIVEIKTEEAIAAIAVMVAIAVVAGKID